MSKYSYILIWLVISLLAGALGHYFFKLDFLFASFVSAIALVVNGLISEWEGRKSESKSAKEKSETDI